MEKMNNDTMENLLNELLEAGEHCVASVYCMHKKTGFFAGPENIYPGYAAATDRGRIILIKYTVVSSLTGDYSHSSFYLEDIHKLKIRKNFFGQYIVDAVYLSDGKKINICFQIAPKILGSNFPYQEQNSEEMFSILSKYKT